MKAPHSLDAERSVLATMLRQGDKVAAEVIGTLLEGKHFYAPPHRVIFEALHENYYADMPLDSLTIGTRCSKTLSKLWSTSEEVAVERVNDLAASRFPGKVIDHAKLIKEHADLRGLLGLCKTIEGEIEAQERGAEEIAGLVSQQAMRIATDSLLTAEIMDFGQLGRNYYEQATLAKKATEMGIELGVKFGMPFLDNYTRGLRATELMLGAGEPGVGKSAVYWKAALRFAQKQMVKTEDKRIGTLVLSLEMGEEPTNVRLAQTLTHIDGGKLREGTMSDAEINKILHEWGRRKGIPLYFNFASSARASQLRALVVEGIRRYNVGLVVIDHFRHFNMDRRYDNQIIEDEDKVKFLKEAIAKDLNTAVICVCHTTKGIAEARNQRPNLTHLRGSYQVAAAADFVSFIHQPYMYATDEARESGEVTESQMEMIWEKNRHGYKGIAQFHMNAARMDIK
jgi:replicative DNA helicase